MARLQTMFFISEALIGIVHRCRLAIDVVCAEFGLLLPVGGVTEFYLIVLALCLLGEVNLDGVNQMLCCFAQQTGIIQVLETETSHLLGERFGEQAVGIVQRRGRTMVIGGIVVVLGICDGSNVPVLIFNGTPCMQGLCSEVDVLQGLLPGNESAVGIEEAILVLVYRQSLYEFVLVQEEGCKLELFL